MQVWTSGSPSSSAAGQGVSPGVSSPFAYGLQLASLTKHVPVDYSHTLLAERVHLVSTRRCLKEGRIFSSGQKTKVTEHTDPARHTRRRDALRGVPKTPLCILLVPRSSFHLLSSPLAAQTSITQMMRLDRSLVLLLQPQCSRVRRTQPDHSEMVIHHILYEKRLIKVILKLFAPGGEHLGTSKDPFPPFFEAIKPASSSLSGDSLNDASLREENPVLNI